MSAPVSISVPVAASHEPLIGPVSANDSTSLPLTYPAPTWTVAPDRVALSTSEIVSSGASAVAP